MHLPKFPTVRSQSFSILAFLLIAIALSPPASAQTASATRIICPKIVGGCDADQRDWPAMAALRVATADERVASYFCGGTVIARRWVLTAAHCLPKFTTSLQSSLRDSQNTPHQGTLQIVLGASDLRNVKPGHVYGVERVVIHERYRAALADAMQIAKAYERGIAVNQIPLKTGHDIALLQLDRPWQGETARLSLDNASDPQGSSGAQLRVAGFGLTDPKAASAIKYVPRTDGAGEILAGSVTLLQTLIPAVSTPACADRYEDSLIGEGQICAGLEQGGSDSCGGDSGGPLMAYDERGQPHQVGLVSWGLENCADHRAYGVYTRISNFADWIQSHTGPMTGAPPLIAREGLTSSQLDAALAQLESALGPGQGRVRIGLGDSNAVRLGDRIIFYAASEILGKLIVLDVNAERKVTLIYPNKFVEPGDPGLIMPGRSVAVPGADYPGFDAFEATEPLGKGLLIALVAPKDFDVERFAADAGIRSKGFAPVKDPPNYFMRFIRQIETYLGLNTRGFEAIRKERKRWGYAVAEYEITR